MSIKVLVLMFVGAFFIISCEKASGNKPVVKGSSEDKISVVAEPVVVTEAVEFDSDDPAIWYNSSDPSKSLVLGTDKNSFGNLFVFNLEGKIVKKVPGLSRPNNVDIEYGFNFKGEKVDIAVLTERGSNKLRIYKLPEVVLIDGGGIPVFENESVRSPMGIALYRRPEDGAVFAIVSRKGGPKQGYLFQYLLEDKSGVVRGRKVRAFGNFYGENEIEAIAVDDEAGYVYYSDESFGVRKYYADPAHTEASRELGVFGKRSFKEDREGISILPMKDGKGYILVSDQAAHRFNIYTREGSEGNPHKHLLVKSVDVKATNSDGSEILALPLNKRFPKGLFIAMSDDRTFHFYDLRDIVGKDKLE